jgi:hypothetical protein
MGLFSIFCVPRLRRAATLPRQDNKKGQQKRGAV